MLKDFLPYEIYNSLILKCSELEVNEIHIRDKMPITVVVNCKTYFLSPNGICSGYNQAIYASSNLIEDIIFKASNYSIYSVNEQICNGYLMVDGGIRIGICGEVVSDGAIKTMKNFSSLCIRIPHLVKNASLPIFNQILNGGNLNNSLIISPPGAGKTTLLRDIIYQFSNHSYPYNIFIADERGEIVGGKGSGLNLGNFYDYVSFLNKKDSLIMGIRSMSPQIVVTDELGAEQDFEAVEMAINCGVCVIASMHAKDITEVKNKQCFKSMLQNKYFKRYIVLSKQNGAGTIEGVYDENMNRIYGAVQWK